MIMKSYIVSMYFKKNIVSMYGKKTYQYIIPNPWKLTIEYGCI